MVAGLEKVGPTGYTRINIGLKKSYIAGFGLAAFSLRS